ncbi:hypothetical protein STEG23_004488 [Scotinomys teguina]
MRGLSSSQANFRIMKKYQIRTTVHLSRQIADRLETNWYKLKKFPPVINRPPTTCQSLLMLRIWRNRNCARSNEQWEIETIGEGDTFIDYLVLIRLQMKLDE